MSAITKVLIPNKEWLIKDNSGKTGSVAKYKKGYLVLHNGQSIAFKNLSEVKAAVGVAFFEESFKDHAREDTPIHHIYGYPCKNKPFEPLYNVQKKLPLYIKRAKSKSQHCAGHYIIKFRKGWVKSFCPKLITLERYPYQGPWKTEEESRQALKKANQTCDN